MNKWPYKRVAFPGGQINISLSTYIWNLAWNEVWPYQRGTSVYGISMSQLVADMFSNMILRCCYLTWLWELGLHNQCYLWSRRWLLFPNTWLYFRFFVGVCVVHVYVHLFCFIVIYLYCCCFLYLDCPLTWIYLWTGVLCICRTYKFHSLTYKFNSFSQQQIQFFLL